MPKSANEVMHDVVYAAVVDAIVALRGASGGLPNTLLRDIGAIHANTTFADLPRQLQAAIDTSTRDAFTRLRREGYTVTNPSIAPDPRSQPRGGRDGPPRRDEPPRAPRSAPPANRAPRDPNRPNRGPRTPSGKPRGPKPG